jgi:L-lactate dehydrogenase (cytochrome)
MDSTVSSIFDLEALAKKRLPEVIFDYVHGGAEQRITLQRNIRDLRALALRQHDMRDVSDPVLNTTMAGEPARIPLAIAPTGLAGLTWPNGECEEARAAVEFGVP